MTIEKTSHDFIDPVCRMNVAKNSVVSPYTVNSKTYYFCTNACREVFVADPGKYLEKKAPARKGLWKRYLDWMNRATGGKPPSCH